MLEQVPFLVPAKQMERIGDFGFSMMPRIRPIREPTFGLGLPQLLRNELA